jgi:hypothetical protein
MASTIQSQIQGTGSVSTSPYTSGNFAPLSGPGPLRITLDKEEEPEPEMPEETEGPASAAGASPAAKPAGSKGAGSKAAAGKPGTSALPSRGVGGLDLALLQRLGIGLVAGFAAAQLLWWALGVTR